MVRIICLLVVYPFVFYLQPCSFSRNLDEFPSISDLSKYSPEQIRSIKPDQVRSLKLDKIPSCPNVTDSNGLKQGYWLEYFDFARFQIFDSSKADYYKIVNYKDDVRYGVSHGYFMDGQLQDEISGDSLMSTSKEEFVITYYKSGKLKVRERAINDTMVEKSYFYEDGSKNYAIELEAYYQDMEKRELDSKIPLALEGHKKHYMENSPEMAVLYHTLGHIYQQKDNNIKANEYLKLSVQIVKALKGETSERYINYLTCLGNNYLHMMFYQESENCFLESLNILKNLKLFDFHLKLTALENLSDLYVTTKRYEEADQILLEIENKTKSNKKFNEIYIKLLTIHGRLCNLLGRYEEAESKYKEALAVYDKKSARSEMCVSTTMYLLTDFYIDKKKFKEAESIALQNIELRKRLYGHSSSFHAYALTNLAHVYLKENKSEEADKLFSQSLSIYNDNPDLRNGRDSYLDQIAYKYLINRYSNKKYIDIADSLLNEALKANDSIYHDENNQLRAHLLSNFASVALTRSNYSLADSFYRKSLNIHRIKSPNARNYFNAALVVLGICNNILGKYSEAEEFFKESNDISLEMIYKYFPRLNEKDKFAFLNSGIPKIAFFYNFAQDYYNQKPEISSQVYNLALATKGLVINSQEKAFRQARNFERTMSNWRSTREMWIQLFQNPGKAKRMGIDIDSLEKVALNYESEISSKSLAFRKAFDTTKITWQDIRKQLKPGEAAVEIIQFCKRSNFYLSDTNCYVALIVTNETNNHPELIILDTVNDIEQNAIIGYNKIINANSIKRSKSVKVSSDYQSELLKELYNKLWKKIDDKLSGFKKVYFAPDGVYNSININTLINPESGKYLLEEKTICLLTNTKNLVEWEKYKFEPTQSTQSVLIGNPEFELPKQFLKKDSISVNPELNRNFNFLPTRKISRLPGTEKEVKEITKELIKSKWQVEDYVGSQALESAVKKLKNPRILHLATHGVFLKDVEMIKEMDILEDRKEQYVENPLLRSMLLFAGAQNTIRGETISGEDDGILTAYEVMNLDLDNTELVVLSACNTGVGEIKNGEGVFGLRRAFQIAGVKTLIMSLWSVNDESTKELMTTFYSKWLSGKSKSDAFRSAQLEMMAKYKNFYNWGGFIMIGE